MLYFQLCLIIIIVYFVYLIYANNYFELFFVKTLDYPFKNDDFMYNNAHYIISYIFYGKLDSILELLGTN